MTPEEESAILTFLRTCFPHAKLRSEPWFARQGGRAGLPAAAPQQDDVRRIGLDPLPRVLLLMLPNLVRVVDALVTVCSWNTNGIMGMDALVGACSWTARGIMAWA